ncbi:MAG: NAD(P)-dependent oxidoreductase, partial [Nannocystaceae bacterium]
MKPRFLIDAKITAGREYLSELGVSQPYDPADLQETELDGVLGLICRTTTPVGPSLIARAPHLQFVATASAGHDHLDLEALRSRGISWCSAPGCNASAVADYTLTAIFRLMEQMRMSRNARIGVVGVGHVGGEVVRRCNAVGLQVHPCDPPLAAAGQVPAGSDAAETHAFAPLSELLRRCDLLTFHVPLTHGGPHPTAGLLQPHHLSESSVKGLINTARGGVVLAAECAALPTAPLQVIDVWAREPAPDPRLLRAPSVLMATPHVAGYGAAAKWAATAQLVPQIAAFLGVPPPAVPSYVPAHTPTLVVGHHPTRGLPSTAKILTRLLGLEDRDRELRAAAAEPPNTRAERFRRLRSVPPFRVEFA